MKKMMFILAASAMLAACGGSGEAPASDSTVVVDSLVPTVDSINAVNDSTEINVAPGGSGSSSEAPAESKDNESLK